MKEMHYWATSQEEKDIRAQVTMLPKTNPEKHLVPSHLQHIIQYPFYTVGMPNWNDPEWNNYGLINRLFKNIGKHRVITIPLLASPREIFVREATWKSPKGLGIAYGKQFENDFNNKKINPQDPRLKDAIENYYLSTIKLEDHEKLPQGYTAQEIWTPQSTPTWKIP